jgi:hypothetical protein
MAAMDCPVVMACRVFRARRAAMVSTGKMARMVSGSTI